MNYRKWTKEDLDFIKSYAGAMSDNELAAKLSEITASTVSVAMVRTQRRKIGLKKVRGRHPKKTDVTKSFVAVNDNGLN